MSTFPTHSTRKILKPENHKCTNPEAYGWQYPPAVKNPHRRHNYCTSKIYSFSLHQPPKQTVSLPSLTSLSSPRRKLVGKTLTDSSSSIQSLHLPTLYKNSPLNSTVTCDHTFQLYEKFKKREEKEERRLSMKFVGEFHEERQDLMISHARTLLWIVRGITTLLLWSFVVRLLTMGEVWGPRLLKTWPSCFTPPSVISDQVELSYVPPKVYYPPKRVYKNNGYLMVSCNGGLNQMRGAICDMVAIARFLNVTLIVPELDKTSFWADSSEFKDIFDVDHFITSLRSEVRILKEMPPRLKRRVDLGMFYSLPPVSWSNISYYHHQILPLLKRYKVVHLNRTDARLANNGLPLEIQKLRCRVNFNALRFTPQIEELGRKVVSILRQNGPFVVLHLRYEMDMLAFSGCSHGCNSEEVKELARMRYAYPWWKEKDINSDLKRKEGLCPLTPEETALVLTALGIDRDVQIYIAAGEIYGGQRRMANLAAAFPNLVRKEKLLDPSELGYFQNHSSQMAALDYLVSLESDIFVPTYDGNMAKVVEGHRRYLGYKKTISLDRKLLVDLVDHYRAGSLSWDEFAFTVKEAHVDHMGSPRERLMIPERPKEEDYFYANPHECLQPLVKPFRYT